MKNGSKFIENEQFQNLHNFLAPLDIVLSGSPASAIIMGQATGHSVLFDNSVARARWLGPLGSRKWR